MGYPACYPAAGYRARFPRADGPRPVSPAYHPAIPYASPFVGLRISRRASAKSARMERYALIGTAGTGKGSARPGIGGRRKGRKFPALESRIALIIWPMLTLAIASAASSLLLAWSFFRKYQHRVRLETLDALRYHRIADYLGRPIPLAFEYRPAGGAAMRVDLDVEEIYHYGRDYFLKGRAPEGKRSLIFKWDRVTRPRVRHEGRDLGSLDELFQAAGGRARAAA